ncbi:MAG: hypothetical protein HFE73_11115 [Firmicutes bacterium]|nr:hypothetical protein [Bacillota bacterium]
MEKIERTFMELNRETAMRLWNKNFGRETKVKDFTGRTIAKGAYNDRNSEFGWNVDHILPQSRGGVTADHNLVCCHILTNDEKADRFPCFTANGISFEIRRVQNHYEIRAREKLEQSEQECDDVDFYDSAAGIRLFKNLKGIQNKDRFVGTVFIYLKSVSNGAVIDFIEKIFDSESISYSKYNNWYNGLSSSSDTYPQNVKITISNFDMPYQSDSSELLDKCVLLNTYLSSYFHKDKYVADFHIYYRIDSISRTTIPKMPSRQFDDSRFTTKKNGLYVNDLVLSNIDAGEKVEKNSFSNFEYTRYNFVFTNLEKNLIKEVKGK